MDFSHSCFLKCIVLCAAVSSMAASCEEPETNQADSDTNDTTTDSEAGDTVFSPTGEDNFECPVDCSVNLGLVKSLPDDLCEAQAIVEHVHLQHCYNSGGTMADSAFSLATWEKMATQYCNGVHLLEGLDGQPVYTEEVKQKYLECALARVNAPCGCTNIPGCGDMERILLSGTLENGEPCEQLTQCASGYCLKETGIWECGVCADLYGDGEAGDTCEMVLDCIAGYYCDDVEGVCKVEKTSCEACTSDAECSLVHACIQGNCEWPHLEEGDDCAASPRGCRAGLTCEDDVCVPMPFAHVAVGEPCNFDHDVTSQFVVCDSDGYCSEEENGICIERGFKGDPCTIINDVTDVGSCMILFQCIEGVCGFPEMSCE